MSLDKLVNHLIELSLTEEHKNDPMHLHAFKVEKLARELVEPARKKAEHHREREKYYTTKLEEAEKKLKEEGITIEAIDPKTGFAVYGDIASGNIQSNFNNAGGNIPKFQPKIDQGMLGDVETAKTKMIDHRNKAEKYEKWVRAFSVCSSDTKVYLTVEDIYFFRLEA